MLDLLTASFLGTPVWMWAAFAGLVVVLLAFDLGVLHRKHREIGVRESLLMSGGYLALGLGFGGWVWSQLGDQAGLEYVTGFLIERAWRSTTSSSSPPSSRPSPCLRPTNTACCSGASWA